MQICWRFYFWLVHNSFEITFPWLFILVSSLFLRQLAISMALAQNLLGRLLSISIKSFIVTIVCHPFLANPFFLCIYGAAYCITILRFLQKDRSLININSLLLSALSIFIKYSDLALTRESQVWKASIKLSLLFKYRVQVLQVCLYIKIAAYTLPNQDSGS